jgi:hypothetical protein
MGPKHVFRASSLLILTFALFYLRLFSRLICWLFLVFYFVIVFYFYLFFPYQCLTSLSEISGSHGGNCEDDFLMICCVVKSRRNSPTFQRYLLPPLSSPWWWRQYAPLKCRSTSTWPRSVTSHKTLNFILAAVRTWNIMCSTFLVLSLYEYGFFLHFSLFSLLLFYWFIPYSFPLYDSLSSVSLTFSKVHYCIQWDLVTTVSCASLLWFTRYVTSRTFLFVWIKQCDIFKYMNMLGDALYVMLITYFETKVTDLFHLCFFSLWHILHIYGCFINTSNEGYKPMVSAKRTVKRINILPAFRPLILLYTTWFRARFLLAVKQLWRRSRFRNVVGLFATPLLKKTFLHIRSQDLRDRLPSVLRYIYS